MLPLPDSVLEYYGVRPVTDSQLFEVDAQAAWLQTASQFLACPNGYEGIRCEREIDERNTSPCRNGATCTDMLAAFVCTCAQGWVGPTCEQQSVLSLLNAGVFQYWQVTPPEQGHCESLAAFLDLYADMNLDSVGNECESQPCANGGVCFDGEGEYLCICTEDYRGDNCEVDAFVCAAPGSYVTPGTEIAIHHVLLALRIRISTRPRRVCPVALAHSLPKVLSPAVCAPSERTALLVSTLVLHALLVRSITISTQNSCIACGEGEFSASGSTSCTHVRSAQLTWTATRPLLGGVLRQLRRTGGLHSMPSRHLRRRSGCINRLRAVRRRHILTGSASECSPCPAGFHDDDLDPSTPCDGDDSPALQDTTRGVGGTSCDPCPSGTADLDGDASTRARHATLAHTQLLVR